MQWNLWKKKLFFIKERKKLWQKKKSNETFLEFESEEIFSWKEGEKSIKEESSRAKGTCLDCPTIFVFLNDEGYFFLFQHNKKKNKINKIASVLKERKSRIFCCEKPFAEIISRKKFFVFPLEVIQLGGI